MFQFYKTWLKCLAENRHETKWRDQDHVYGIAGREGLYQIQRRGPLFDKYEIQNNKSDKTLDKAREEIYPHAKLWAY